MPSSVFPETTAAIGFDSNDWIGDFVLKVVFDKGYKVKVSKNWQTRRETLEGVLDMEWLSVWDHYEDGIAMGDGYVAQVVLNKSSHRITVTVSAVSGEVGRKVIADIKKKIKEVKAKIDPNIVPINFWSHTAGRGPRSVERDIAIPSWSTIQNNYEENTLAALNRLFGEFTPSKGGQLILWHGVPGTGKTYALRSLAKEWLDWCSFEYIVDPEKFFGDAEYMMSVLLDNASVPAFMLDEDEDEDDKAKDRWRVLIFEDTGELLMEDAKDITGQGLSRLLNTVDGLIGQGLKVLILITTNEKLNKMHPAIIRPGRAAYNIEFNALSASEADAWAAEHGLAPPGAPTTVAALYGALEGFEKPSKKKNGAVIGFRAPAAPSRHSTRPWAERVRNEG